jgi:hypothetical protein
MRSYIHRHGSSRQGTFPIRASSLHSTVSAILSQHPRERTPWSTSAASAGGRVPSGILGTARTGHARSRWISMPARVPGQGMRLPGWRLVLDTPRRTGDGRTARYEATETPRGHVRERGILQGCRPLKRAHCCRMHTVRETTRDVGRIGEGWGLLVDEADVGISLDHLGHRRLRTAA